MRLLLASASPERRRLLVEAGFEVEVESQDVREAKARGPGEVSVVVAANAARKARAAAARHRDRVVVAADTLVYDEERVYGKPRGPGEALEFLMGFRGRRVHVATGLAVAARGVVHCTVDAADVVFRRFTRSEAEAYVRSGEPLGKAGAFSIRGRGAMLVERVEGHPSTVLGLPLHRLAETLRAMGLLD